MRKTLRPYQLEASDAAFEYLTSKPGKPIVVAPVGAGKSLLMAELMRRGVEVFQPMRFLSLAHSSELLRQNAEELAGYAPHISYSFYADKLKQKRLDGQCMFASIQSLYRKPNIIPRVDVCLLDECHLTGRSETKMYRTLLDALWLGNPDMRLVGYTGTPFNIKGEWLHEGPDALFDEIAFSISMTELIRDGYLCPLETPQVSARIDVTGIKTIAGDYALNELEAASDRPEIIQECVADMVRHGADCRKWLVFAVSVKHAMHIRDEVRAHGISCESVTGETPTNERRSSLQNFEHGDLRCLINVMALTAGYNNPKIDLLAIMRPTRSRTLYVQAIGRGLRTAPGKTRCKVCDYGGVVAELGPVDQITARPPRRIGTADAPMKSCERCHEILYASARICHACGHVFPIQPGDINLTDTASSAAVLSTQKIDPVRVRVDDVVYSRHEKAGSPPSMLAEYRCGATRHREWICFQHTGRARANAMQWWMSRASGNPPLSVDEALARAREIEQPSEIGLVKEGKYFMIVGYAFDDPLTDPTPMAEPQRTIAAGTR